MHHVTRMLENNSVVRCLLVDFSTAFDRVDHVVLVQKLSKLKLPQYVFNWLISFITGRSHTTRCSGIESKPLPINLGIVQGSALGPSLYITLESDLKPISNTNLIFKYADDTNLLVPECTDVQICDEFDALLKWAEINKMIVNTSKTKDIVFRRQNPRLLV
jgi:Reverse transcriptase (RNA-dependent DNA polymerase)